MSVAASTTTSSTFPHTKAHLYSPPTLPDPETKGGPDPESYTPPQQWYHQPPNAVCREQEKKAAKLRHTREKQTHQQIDGNKDRGAGPLGTQRQFSSLLCTH